MLHVHSYRDDWHLRALTLVRHQRLTPYSSIHGEQDIGHLSTGHPTLIRHGAYMTQKAGFDERFIHERQNMTGHADVGFVGDDHAPHKQALLQRTLSDGPLGHHGYPPRTQIMD